MDWLSVLCAALPGALAATVASLLLLRKSKDRHAAYSVVTVILFLGFKFLSDQSLLPKLHEWQTDKQLRALPFYRELAEGDPQTYEKVRIVTSDAVRKGEGADLIASRIAPIVAATVPKFIGAASDDSVITFIDVSIRQIEALRSSPGACYYFMFPQEKAPFKIASSLDKKSRDESLKALDGIVHSAVHTPQPLPDAKKADALLAPVLEHLASEFGTSLLLLQQKPTDTDGRQKVCDITVSLYKNIDALPQRDASLLLRYLLSDSGASKSDKPERVKQ